MTSREPTREEVEAAKHREYAKELCDDLHMVQPTDKDLEDIAKWYRKVRYEAVMAEASALREALERIVELESHTSHGDPQIQNGTIIISRVGKIARAAVRSMEGEEALQTLPVAFRVKAFLGWSLFEDEEAAQAAAACRGVDYQGLYAREGK